MCCFYKEATMLAKHNLSEQHRVLILQWDFEHWVIQIDNFQEIEELISLVGAWLFYWGCYWLAGSLKHVYASESTVCHWLTISAGVLTWVGYWHHENLKSWTGLWLILVVTHTLLQNNQFFHKFLRIFKLKF
jgi:hypothetical protein